MTACLRPNYDIHCTPKSATIAPLNNTLCWPGENTAHNQIGTDGFRVTKHSKYPVKIRLKSIRITNDTARDILLAADGTKTVDDIYKEVLAIYGEPYGTHYKVFHTLVENFVNTGIFLESAIPQKVDKRVTGSVNYYVPYNVSIEVTAACNIRCMHCYGRFSRSRVGEMDGERWIELLENLYRCGVRQVEMTGGECTVHEDFDDILEYACSKFDIVALLTNGIRISDRAFDILTDHAHHVLVQISINGDKDYHTKFTQSDIAFDKATRSVARLAKSSVFVNCPMNVCIENFHLVRPALQQAMALGASRFMPSLIQDYGRFEDLKKDAAASSAKGQESGSLSSCPHTFMGKNAAEQVQFARDYVDLSRALAAEYEEFATNQLTPESEKMKKYFGNCGAVMRTLYVASDGRAMLCPVSAGAGIPALGNIATSGIETVMCSDYARTLSTLKEPTKDSCAEECKYLGTCGCIANGLKHFFEEPDICTWAHSYNMARFLPHVKQPNERGTLIQG
jgi:MoaA/NifB/PqqE/SkfB family radical SAM enzyme